MIKFVYFDVGGVVIKDFSKTNKWEELRVAKSISKQDFDELRGKLSMGQINLNEVGLSLNDFISRYDTNKSIWPIIVGIKKKYKIGLLTNQYRGLLEAIVNANLMPVIDWDVTIDSSIEGVKKPDPKIYEIAEKSAEFSGSEILFVENGEKHIKTAQEFGWQTFLYDSSNYEKSSQNLAKVFDRLKLLESDEELVTISGN
jgi:HAD superfamily hydrolase (TIGR01509 family)